MVPWYLPTYVYQANGTKQLCGCGFNLRTFASDKITTQSNASGNPPGTILPTCHARGSKTQMVCNHNRGIGGGVDQFCVLVDRETGGNGIKQ